jgi:tetratricopeptide (TPR) repeat protein
MEEANQLAAKALGEARQLVEDAPEKAYRWVLLSDAWLQNTKNSWHRNLLPETIAAYRQLLSSLRRAVELAPGCYRYKRQLAERTIRFGRCLREFGSFDEAESCFLAPLHACPSDPLLLHQAAHEMSELAREIASRHSPLAPAHQEQYQRCLEQSRVLNETALNLQKSEKPYTSGK